MVYFMAVRLLSTRLVSLAVGNCVCREILKTQEIYDAGQYF